MPNYQKEESVSQYVGNFLKRELKRRGKTQESFAEEVGVADRTVRRWVSGEIHSLEGVQEIAWALNISIRDIFSEWDDVPSHFLRCDATLYFLRCDAALHFLRCDVPSHFLRYDIRFTS